MKATLLLSSLCLAPLALAAPLPRFPTLVAGTAIHKLAPAHREVVLLQVEEEVHRFIISPPTSTPTPSEEESSSPMLDVDRPKTTHELMNAAALSSFSPPPPSKSSSKASGNKAKVVSVGTLVVPGKQAQANAVLRNLYNPDSTPRYLVPAEFIAHLTAKRIEMLAVGLILACVLAVIAVELWELVADCATSVFRRRQGAIRLGDVRDLEECEAKSGDDDDDDDDDCDAPFGGYSHRDETRGWKLPEKLNEKAACI